MPSDCAADVSQVLAERSRPARPTDNMVVKWCTLQLRNGEQLVQCSVSKINSNDLVDFHRSQRSENSNRASPNKMMLSKWLFWGELYL